MGLAEQLKVREFHRKHRVTLARLDRVRATIAKLEKWEAFEAMPAEMRPEVEKPLLRREALESLGNMLEEALAEMEQAWERRPLG